MLRRLARVIAVLAPAALALAWPAPVAADPPTVLSVDAWIKVLPAPPTPDDWAPPPGPRVAWPLHGVITQPFGCSS